MIRLRGVKIPAIPVLDKPNWFSTFLGLVIVGTFLVCMAKAFLGYLA